MVKNFYYILFLLLFFIQESTAQKQHENLSLEIGELIDKATKQNRLSDAIKFVDQAIRLSRQSNKDSVIIATYYKKPLLAAILGDFDKSLQYLHEFDSVLLKHYHPYYDFRRYTLYAYDYSMKNNYDIGLKYNLKSIEIAKKNQDEAQLADAYNNIGKEYMNLGDKENSYKYLKLADSIYMKINGRGTYILYNNLSQVAHNYEEAKVYSQKAYQLLDTTDLKDLALFYIIRADAFQTQEHYKESLIAGRKAYDLAHKIDNRMVQNTAMVYMGKNYYYLNDLDSALIYLEKGLQYNKEMLSNKMETARMLSKVYEKKGDYKKAFQYHKTYVQYYDSIEYNEAKTKYAEFNIKYETARKDREIALQKLELAQKKKARDRILFGSLLILLLLTGFFQWYTGKQRKKKQIAEEKLNKEKEMNRMRKRFIENIAHEIRTPLSLINGHISMALENIHQPAIQKKHLSQALSASENALFDAQEILALLKSEYEKQAPQKEDIFVEDFCRRIFYSFQSLAQLKGIELIYRSHIDKGVFICSDRQRIEKIINNFISNAIKFSPSGKQIIFEVIAEEDNIIVKVTDSGPGIPPGEQSKIFDRFYQLKNTSNAGGMGIGLSIAKELADSLGAKLIVESLPGKQTTFALVLPAVLLRKTKREEAEQEEVSIPAKPEININPDDKPRILIVEDNPEMNAFLKSILSPFYDCDMAFDGIEALQKVQKNDYAIVLSDVMMPRLNGYELKMKMNRLERTKNIPFVFLTAKAELPDRIRGFQMGVDDYITKPFAKEELLTRIERLIVNRKVREQWYREKGEPQKENATGGEQLLVKAKTIIRKNLENENFRVADLAGELAYSVRQLNRIMKQMSGLTPLQFILEMRLQKAYYLLSAKQYATLAEVRHKVGMPGATHFNKKFKERFGISPARLMKNGAEA